MPFFKRIGEEIVSAPNFVSGPDFELTAAQKDTYQYPVQGWYWFDTLDAALDSGKLKAGLIVAVSPRQAELALLQKGVLGTVEAVIAAQPRDVQISYNRATEFKRNDLMLNAVCQNALGWSDVEIDELFELAASIPG